MTPTEQDKELEAQLDKIFPCDCSFKKGFAFKPGDPCDGSCVNAPYRKAVLELITADRKRVALEARRNEALIADRNLGQYPDYHKMKTASLKRIDDIERGLFISVHDIKAQQEET